MTATCCHRRRRSAAGFTLIEVMITVAILGILASVAYPSYRSAVIKGQRAEGRAALIDLMHQEERHLTAKGTYADLDPAATSGLLFKNFSGDERNRSAYRLGAAMCPVVPAVALTECVMVFAEPTFADAEVQTLRIWSTGKKDCAGSSAPTRPDLCWR